MPPLDAKDLVEDAYAAISKDEVGSVEVGIWIQKSLGLLAQLPTADLSQAARDQACISFARAEKELTFPHDLLRVQQANAFISERNVST